MAARVEKLVGHLQAPAAEEGAKATLEAQETSGLQDGGNISGSYDYVVIGAGSAGCVVASRLSEDPNVSVLLLEAGGNNQSVMAVQHPLVKFDELQNSPYDWAHRSTPQTKQDDRVSHWPRGKCLGGSSSINAMLYVRGDPRNYDQWEEEYGCEGWSYKDVLPYFLKSENLITSDKMDSSFHASGHHSTKGPLRVTDLNDPAYEMVSRETGERFVAACSECGIKGPHDYNGPVQEGASLAQVTIHDGKRTDTATCFLFDNDVVKRPNLTVVTHAHVEKIVIQGDTAVGVLVKTGDVDAETLKSDKIPSQFIPIRREVIVSAGTTNTPQVLMLSGIGPRAELEKFNIPVAADLPVGKNLVDHLFAFLEYEYAPGVASFSGKPLQVIKAFWDYYVNSTGPLMSGGVTAMAFLRSGLRPEKDGNDLQIHLVPYPGNDLDRIKANFGLDTTTRETQEKGLERCNFMVTLDRPHSRGHVGLNSASPFDPPLIDPNYLSEEIDVDALVYCYRKTMEIAEKTKALGPHFAKRVINPDSTFAPDSDAYIREEIRKKTCTVYHPVGTAKMGSLDDPTVVCDAKTLKVKGFRNIRVADCSVMPDIVSGNTNAPAIMIGERAADMIRAGP
ncbi:Choline dehydrogenase, mitochondrial [Hondaea fermentalgiana]|uniref:Choline dehydrogenase, mitochondrial n=1 Tax=Hondaea fermentalgiana TaxID=2315210 RepID=A0A2R5GT44_9STRA|nr:Choline dehydrogenase, mitochondrial [Hondaea fermentalgiana]|eukprot:GBG33489.1 Choline dehydrogenase, mitochondrial [Hondaea fermentalgiana]